MTNGVRAWCLHCGEELDPDHVGGCPRCGMTGKKVEATASVGLGLRVTESAERTRTWFEWLRSIRGREISSSIVGITIGLVVSAIVGIVVYFFVNLSVALLGIVYSWIIILSVGIYLRLGTELASRELRTRIGMRKEVELWDCALSTASKSDFLTNVRAISLLVLLGVTAMVVLYCATGTWEWYIGLTYTSIIFILYSVLVHLSDRLFMNPITAIRISQTSSEVNFEYLVELAKKRLLGRLSATFVLLGAFVEIVNLSLEVLGAYE